MIPPDKLTAENGFMEGVVVEVEYHDYTGKHQKQVGRLHLESSHELWLDWWDDESISPSDLVSIRPLTGPTAIWNFAPEWATFCRIMSEDRQGDTIYWYGPLHEHDKKILRGAVDTTERPWWAQRREE
jgi:hypothetical protein